MSNKMQLGIGTYAFGWSIGVPGSIPEKPMTVYDFIGKAAEFGLSCAQIADNIPLAVLDDAELDRIRQYATARGVLLETGGRGMTPPNLQRHIDIAYRLGSPLLRMVIDAPGFQPAPEDVIALLKDFVRAFKARNIRLAIENHDRFKARQFRAIVDGVGSPWVGICLDSVNSLGADEGFETVFGLLAPVCFNLHIKDYTIRRKSHMMGFDVLGTPAGSGMMPIPFILETLARTGLCRSAILEQWPWPEDTVGQTVAKEQEWAAQSIAYLKPFFS